MAASDQTGISIASDFASGPPPTAGRQDVAKSSAGRRQVLIGLSVALLIIAIAWGIGGRAGWDAIGQGGINQSLLPKVGEKAPEFLTEDVFGNPVRLSDFAGQPVWLMFWGSWCPPCRAEFPDIQAAYEKVAPDGVKILGVSVRESALEAATYAGQNGATWLVLSDPDEADTEAAYPIRNFPTHIFIDRDGVIRSIVLQQMNEEMAIAEARKLLEPLPSSSV